MDQVYMGTSAETWMANKSIKYITFNVTDDCNLACKYCYFTHKTNKRVMTFDIAKKAIDAILENPDFLEEDGVVWDFIGGEPTLELDLIDKICDYILTRMYELNHKWLYCYKFFLGSNGLLYSSPKMQKLIKKHGDNIQVGITLDGSKEKHDLSRVKKDGSGSYDDIVSQIPLWQKQQGGLSTKATFSHDDLPYLKESIINLWNLGIKNVMANIVFEDVWEDGDDQIYKQQLFDLADYIIENNLWDKYSVRFFNHQIGMPISDAVRKRNFCGTGKMLAISTDGKYYPCVRFMDSALNKQKGLVIGGIDTGWDSDKLRAFKALDTEFQSTDECLNCEIASGCFWCSGFNYDASKTGTLFERKTNICKMHKANVEACRYLWKEYEKVKGVISPLRASYLGNTSRQHKFMYIILNSHMLPFCNYSNNMINSSAETMGEEMLHTAMEYCDANNYSPIFIGDMPHNYKKFGYTITDNTNDDLSSFSTCIVFNHDTIKQSKEIKCNNLIYLIKTTELCHMNADISNLIEKSSNIPNISIIISDMDNFTRPLLNEYASQLDRLVKIIFEYWKSGKNVEINVLTHILHFDKHKECSAGNYSLALAPNGNFYICPAFYFDDSIYDKFNIGNIKDGVNNVYQEFCKIEKSKICGYCDAYHCSKCSFISKKKTNEFCVPSELSCLKSNIEREKSRIFVALLTENHMLENIRNPISQPITHLDPLHKMLEENSFDRRSI